MGFISSMYMAFATRELGLNAALLGAVISVGGVSSLFGAIAADRLARRFGFGPTFIGAAVLTGFTGLVPVLAHGPVAVCAAFLAAGQLFDAAWPIYSISETSLRQAVAPNHILGRVNASMDLLFRGILPLGALAGGAIAQVIGIRATMFAGATGFLLSTL